MSDKNLLFPEYDELFDKRDDRKSKLLRIINSPVLWEDVDNYLRFCVPGHQPGLDGRLEVLFAHINKSLDTDKFECSKDTLLKAYTVLIHQKRYLKDDNLREIIDELELGYYKDILDIYYIDENGQTEDEKFLEEFNKFMENLF